MATKHLTPEDKCVRAEEKVLHGHGKILSTDGKSLLDTVNLRTLVTKPRVRSEAKSLHESESTQSVVTCAPKASEQALRVFRPSHDKRRFRRTPIGRLSPA
jgi:hypothetical protein